MKLKNPFLTRGYAGGEYFCDRENELRKILAAIENDRDITLIAPRRFGKTGLIRHVFANLPKEYTGIYLDIFSTKDLASFTSTFADAVIGALDTKLESAFSAVGRFIKSCRPTVTPQAEGLPKFSFDVAPEQAKATLSEVFEYLKSKEQRVVIAIDEFQQINEYPEGGVEALLRSHIQFVPNVRFVFAGSHKHLMQEMFVSPKRPFYQSTQILSLSEIPVETYCAFAGEFFKQAKLAFDPEVFAALYRRFDGVTWYVQAVLNRVWEARAGLRTSEQIDWAVDQLISDQSLVFHDLLRSQNSGSRNLLKAIAKEGPVASPQSGAFVAKSGLVGASSVGFALRDLKERDLVYETEKGWIVYDRLFGEWLRTH